MHAGLIPAAPHSIWKPTENPNVFGVWWRELDDFYRHLRTQHSEIAPGGSPNSTAVKQEAPFVRGIFIAIPWSELEPADGHYDWKLFDDTFARYARAGLYIQFMVWVGPDSPRWIYSAGVPEVHTTPDKRKFHDWTYPFYLDANYKTYYHRLIRAVAAHIDTLPKDVRARIICIQTAEGTTGDVGGYKGDPVDPKYNLPDDKWNAFKEETWELFDRLYRPKQPPIHLLINAGNELEHSAWLNQRLPNAWLKAGNPGHGYQLNDEKHLLAAFDPLINHPESGHLVRVRSEMSERDSGWFEEAPVWNMYWLNLWGLHFGLDIFQHETGAFENRAFDEGFRFYAKYGGRKDAATSPGAWCALRDGLDAEDTVRFPPAEFGNGSLRGSDEAQKQGLQRTLNIVRAFSSFGAEQGDPEKAMKLTVQNRSAKRMNDVGWNIVAGNYQRYMRQWDPNGTSQGYWRQGAKDQPYGRFARGFDTKHGKNTMYFDIEDRFFKGRPLAGAYPMILRVVYLDQGTGSFSVQYDSVGDPARTALKIKKTDSGRWKESTVRIADGNFANRCPHSTDLMLVNGSGEDTLFHLIEITRGA